MKKLTATLMFSLAMASTSAMAYQINGSSEDGFVLKCNDGYTNTGAPLNSSKISLA